MHSSTLHKSSACPPERRSGCRLENPGKHCNVRASSSSPLHRRHKTTGRRSGTVVPSLARMEHLFQGCMGRWGLVGRGLLFGGWWRRPLWLWGRRPGGGVLLWGRWRRPFWLWGRCRPVGWLGRRCLTMYQPWSWAWVSIVQVWSVHKRCTSHPLYKRQTAFKAATERPLPALSKLLYKSHESSAEELGPGP